MCVLRLLLLPAEYDKYGTVIWSTGTDDPYVGDEYSLVCQSDGNVVLYNLFEDVIWSTGTCCH